MPITLDPSLPRSLYPLAWLIGEWEGSGALAAPSPGTPDVRVEQRLVCSAQDDGTLAWRSTIHRVDAPAPLPPTSAFARTEFQAVQFMPLVIGPQIFLCGLIAPREGMPEVLQRLSDVLPMTYAVEGLQAIGTQAAPVGDVARNVGVLALFAVGALLVAALSMPRQTR